ncbi:hypothetical protein [Siphonobacter sp. SORGH_AS_0500]|uniref:hypothetical protein n=1 Tax=Siphonobacter sp. SORGH_AS_0500 TaxID=1864824 RepID=UPI002860477B|nr:hypothetical protein [Siphonobacter sp. SORGH_AS_0500]MDR6193049.1 hypothetical protein [Siphonobacter sp. SORGH_AS_0500]
MKTRFLFPHWCKPLGWWLAIPFLILGIIYVSRSNFIEQFEPYASYFEVKIPKWLVIIDDEEDLGIQNFVSNNILDEIITIGLTLGLLFVAFSKEKVEDEWVAQVRLESLQWGVLLNTVFIILATLMVYSFKYLDVLIYNVFTTLIIFIVRFNWVLYIQPFLFKGKRVTPMI